LACERRTQASPAAAPPSAAANKASGHREPASTPAVRVQPPHPAAGRRAAKRPAGLGNIGGASSVKGQAGRKRPPVGRGLATKAAAACSDYARDVLGVDRLMAIIALGNRPSQRVAEKLGLALDRQTDNQSCWPSPQRIYAMSCASASAGRLLTESTVSWTYWCVPTSLERNTGQLVRFSVQNSSGIASSRCHSMPLAATCWTGYTRADLHEWLFLLVTA
jgi:hypothetical protein